MVCACLSAGRDYCEFVGRGRIFKINDDGIRT